MVLITHTNIIIDDFFYGKKNPFQTYIFFLTHFHQDHWAGLNASWSFGKIYCSELTKRLIINRFPSIRDIESLELNVPHTIYLNDSKSLFVEVYLFDANHCPGSVMILFRGYMGTIFHTGDFRFHQGMIENNPVLFPLTLRNVDNIKCSIHIDEMIFDDTYCDPVFKFTDKKQALKDLIEIIEMNRGKKVFICTDSLGKEELMIDLAEYFQTLVVVNDQRYRNIIAINYRPDLFTTNPEEGFIEITNKMERRKKLEANPNSITITPTGWANIRTYTSPDGKNYIVPYSLHSNFREMETFIRSIQPCILKKVNKNRRIDEKYQKLIEFNKYLFGLKKLKQRGYDEFIKNYTDREKISAEYRTWTEREAQEKLALELGLKSPPEKKKEENTKLFEAENSNVFKHKNRLTLGAKLLGFDNNKNLSNDHIKILKKQQILVSSASSSYSELFKNPNLLKEQSQQPKRTNSFQIVSTPPQQNSLSVQIESRNRSRSVDLDDRIPNREEIEVNSQEEYIFQGLDLFTVKREEIMDEENAVVTDCFPNRSENLGRTVKNSSQIVREFEKGKVLANNMMDIEFNEEHLRDEEMLIEDNNLPRTTISVLHNQMDEEVEDEKESIHPRESKSRLSRKRSILKKNFTNDSLSERLSLSSRSNSRSEKRVRFEDISDEDEEGEEKDNELEEKFSKKNDEKNQDPRKSQISIISKLLQKRLEKEEQSRGITNLLTMSPQTNIIEKNNTVEEKKLSEVPQKQFGLGSKEKSQGTLSKPFAPPLNVKQKDSPNTSTSTLVGQANQTKQITETHSTSKEERKDSINMSELWKSINTSSSRSDNNSKKKVPSYNPDRSRLSFFASAPSLDLNSKTQKQSNDIAKKSPLSSLSKSFEISHVQETHKDAALEGKKKVQIPANTSKIIPNAGNDNTVQPLVSKNNGLRSSGTNKANMVDVSNTRTLVTHYNTLKPPVEDKAVSMRSTSPASDTTYDNSKSFNHEVEEFLKKTRQKRQEESLQTEEIKKVVIPQAREVSLSNYSSSLRDESNNQRVNFTHPRAEDSRSKLRLKNADNVDITLEFDDNLYTSRVLREPKGKSHQPINRIVTESQEEESDEYEEIIVIRRKRNSVVRNEPISMERESNYNPVVNQARPGDESKSLPMPLPQSDTVRELNYSTRPAGDNLLRSTSHTHMKSNQIANNHPNHTGVNTHSEGLRQPLEQTQLLETPSKKPLEKKASISSEKSVDTVRRILDKKSNSNASIEAVPAEKELYNNARGSELVQLSTKLNRKKNLIEEDDPDDESLNFDFDGESANIKQAFSRNAKSYEQVKTTQRRKSNYRTSKTFPQAESPKATKKLKARPLVSFPNGVVITQSEHIRRMKKEKLAKGAAINLNPEISDALGQLFSIFIDRRALG